MQKMLSAESVLKAEIVHLESRITLAEKRLQSLRGQRLILLKKTQLLCPTCETKSQIGLWTFIQVFHYIKPHSCDEGDYWLPSNIEVCTVVCPLCKKEHYLYRHPQKRDLSDLAEKVANVHELFSSVEERYPKD